jgi:magnesium-protoporphyrin IX monomethyl ester (oxidative) cyclase
VRGAALRDTFLLAARLAAQGQTNFIRMLWKFSGVYNVERLVADHHRDVQYEIRLPEHRAAPDVHVKSLFVHAPQAATAAR